MHHPPCLLCKLGGVSTSKHNCLCILFIRLKTCFDHCGPSSGHKIYEEEIYSVRSLLVQILSFQRDLVVLRLSILKLIIYHHHHKHQGLDPLIHSVSRVTAARANVSSVFQLFSFLVVCSGMISKGFGFVAFFASVKANSVCIHLSCLVCL